MAGRSKSSKEQKTTSETIKIKCACCGRELSENQFYTSKSEAYKHNGRLNHCKDCIRELYHMYVKRYKAFNYPLPYHKAIERVCMLTDVYYGDEVVDSAIKTTKTSSIEDPMLMSVYFRIVKIKPNSDKDYDDTIRENIKNDKDKAAALAKYLYDEDDDKDERMLWAEKFFGAGFEEADYGYLMEQYEDWTARHECKTKAQEEVFKQICFTQLDLWKKSRAGADTKDLMVTFQKWLDAAKLQPKQNTGDTVTDAQTFGTLINKWENTRPIPEIDEELKDVDGFGKYISMFFRGCLAKMMGFDNAVPEGYDEYMEQYTAHKPECDDDEDDVDSDIYDRLYGAKSDDAGGV